MGLFDRFRRSSRTEPERDTSRGGGQSSSRLVGADKLTRDVPEGSLSSDQEVLDAIAAILAGGSAPASTTPAGNDAPGKDAEASSGNPENDLISALMALVEEAGSEDSSQDEEGHVEAIETQAESAADEPDQDLLGSIASLMGQPDASAEAETEPEEETSPSPETEDKGNPFGEIAALMGQDDSDNEDPSPTDTSSEQENQTDGDLLSSLAALMGQSMYASEAQEEPDTSSAAAIDPALEERLQTLVADCERHKSKGALASAKAVCEEAYEACRESDALRGVACRNGAAFLLSHLGEGREAARLAREALSCGNEFRTYSQGENGQGADGAFGESLRIAALTSTSYDEAISYAEQGAELYGEPFSELLEKLKGFREDHPRWADYQRKSSLEYYSRESPEQDKGDYAPAMSILQIMLDHAADDAYNLSYEERTGMLDDYGTITIMHLLGQARSTGLSQEDFSKELAFMADGPLKALADFMPECRSAEKPAIERIVQGMKMLPGVVDREAFAPLR